MRHDHAGDRADREPGDPRRHRCLGIVAATVRRRRARPHQPGLLVTVQAARAVGADQLDDGGDCRARRGIRLDLVADRLGVLADQRGERGVGLARRQRRQARGGLRDELADAARVHAADQPIEHLDLRVFDRRRLAAAVGEQEGHRRAPLRSQVRRRAQEQFLAGHVGELAADDHDAGVAGGDPLERRGAGVDLVEPVAPGDHAAQPAPRVGIRIGEQELVRSTYGRRPHPCNFIPRMWQSTVSLANAVGTW